MGKSKRGQASSSLYTPGPLELNVDLQLLYHFILNSDWSSHSPLTCDYCAGCASAVHCIHSIVLSLHVIKE